MSKGDANAFLPRLSVYGLFDSLVKIESEIEFVLNYDSKSIDYSLSDEEAIGIFCKKYKINNDDELKAWKDKHFLHNNNFNLTEFAHYQLKKDKVAMSLISGTGESLYLRYKDRLDRVLYRVIRLSSEDFAQHIYYSIDSGEITFGEAANKYSEGPESKTEGFIGPVDLTTPHPEISSRLKTATPNQLFEPFKAEEWFTIIRLEYRFESEFNDQTKKFLGQLLLGAKANSIRENLINGYKNSF